jgi:hypothetical protein
VKNASPEDRVEFVNSGFTRFPERSNSGGVFPELVAFRNLPRQIILGVAIGF